MPWHGHIICIVEPLWRESINQWWLPFAKDQRCRVVIFFVCCKFGRALELSIYLWTESKLLVWCYCNESRFIPMKTKSLKRLLTPVGQPLPSINQHTLCRRPSLAWKHTWKKTTMTQLGIYRGHTVIAHRLTFFVNVHYRWPCSPIIDTMSQLTVTVRISYCQNVTADGHCNRTSCNQCLCLLTFNVWGPN